MREVPLHGERTLAAATPEFDLVGLHWRGSGAVQFRTRSPAGKWSAWRRADPEAEDLPNAGTAEARAEGGWRIGNPYWTGAADAIQYRLHGRVDRLRAYFVRSPEVRIPLRRVSMVGSPLMLSREVWGANEAIRRAPPSYAPSVQFALVHHTAGTNSYTASQSAAIVRGIEIYHVKGNGWNDIGYNFLVDKYGQVFEGRYGGVDRPVIGAHAEGFNTGSVGVAVLGSYGSSAPPKVARTALANLLAWRLDIAHVDPTSSLTWALRRQRALCGRSSGRVANRLRPSRHGLHDVSRGCALRPAPCDRAAGRGDRVAEALCAYRPRRDRRTGALPRTSLGVAALDRDGRGLDRDDRGDRHRHEPGRRLDVGRHSGCAGLVLVDDRGGRHGAQRNRHHRREGCRPGDPLGDGGSADDHAERRRADRLEPHHVHAQRPRNRDGDVAWSRRARSLRALLASAQTGKADLPLHGGGGCRRSLRDRPERDQRHRNGHDCDSRSRRPNGSRLHRHTGRGVAERRRQLRCAHFRVRAHTSCVGPARRRSGGKDARTRLLRRPAGRSRVRVLEHHPV